MVILFNDFEILLVRTRRVSKITFAAGRYYMYVNLRTLKLSQGEANHLTLYRGEP